MLVSQLLELVNCALEIHFRVLNYRSQEQSLVDVANDGWGE